MTSRLDQSPPLAQPAPEPKRPRRAGRVLAVVAGLFVAYVIGLAMGTSNSTVQAQPVAQPAPIVTTRTVTVPGPTVTVPGPTVTVQASPSASPATSDATEASAGTSFSSGTYQVGTDIQPGTYRTSGSGFCYWARLSSNDGELGSINANGFAEGPGSMSVKSSDEWIEFSGDCTWTKR